MHAVKCSRLHHVCPIDNRARKRLAVPGFSRRSCRNKVNVLQWDWGSNYSAGRGKSERNPKQFLRLEPITPAPGAWKTRGPQVSLGNLVKLYLRIKINESWGCCLMVKHLPSDMRPWFNSPVLPRKKSKRQVRAEICSRYCWSSAVGAKRDCGVDTSERDTMEGRRITSFVGDA